MELRPMEDIIISGLATTLIIIPCHRVAGSNGALIGYASGLDIKKKILERENNFKQGE